MKKHTAISIALSIPFLVQCTTPVVRQGQPAEFAHALTIVMHEPHTELFPAVLHPESAGFADYFNYDLAASEHALFARQLRIAGVNVLTVRDLLLKGTIDENGYPVEGDALNRLREFASGFIVYNMDTPDSEAEQADKYKNDMINRANPQDLVRIILMRPEITIRRSADGKEHQVKYSINPSVNLFSTRDLMISTAKGLIVGRMTGPGREADYRIAAFCLDKLDLTPVGRISREESLLAGGDFMPFGRNAFIATGSLTNQSGVNELMENDWLGCDSLIVVKSTKQYAGKTLDNYFNIIDRDLATLCGQHYEAPPDSEFYLAADVYVREENTYRKIAEAESFVRYVEDRLNMKIIPISEEDQYTCAGNYLTISPRRIIAVSGQSEQFKAALSEQQVDVTWMPLDNIIKSFGTPHSLTQVIGRQRIVL